MYNLLHTFLIFIKMNRIIILVFSCFLFINTLQAQENVNRDKKLVVIAADTIYLDDIKIRTKLNALQKGLETDDTVSLFQLIQSAKTEFICNKYGFPLLDTLLRIEYERIDSHTHNPELLQKIKATAYNNSKPSQFKNPRLDPYIKNYILPNLTQRWAILNYSWNYKIHKSIGDSAKKILDQIKASGNDINQIAKQNHLIQNILYISKEKGIYSKDTIKVDTVNKESFIDLTQQANPELNSIVNSSIDKKGNQITDQLINTVLCSLKPFQLHSTVIEMESYFIILQLLDTVNGEYKVNTIQFPKRNFFEWQDIENALVPSIIFDSSLFKTF